MATSATSSWLEDSKALRGSAARTADSPSKAPTWELGLVSLETELAEQECQVEGTLPPGLQGALYRNGPGRMDTFGHRNHHWFDGDGMLHAIALGGGRATYKNRFVATPGKALEDAARRRIYSGFGTPRPGNAISRFLHRNERKNPANTNVVFHAGKLLALCEGGGPPVRVDPDTLATIGEDSMGGAIGGADVFSAHPKLDRATGEMWNFGVSYGREITIQTYRTTKQGVTDRPASFPIPFGSMVHDFALTATKALFVVTPLALPKYPIALLLGQRSFADSLRWQPELGTRIAVLDRKTGHVDWLRTDPFMMFHTANAWDEGDDIVVDLVVFPDGHILQALGDVMVGSIQNLPHAFLERLHIRKDGRVERRRLSDVPMEFPRVMGRFSQTEATRVHGVSWHERGFIGAPVVVDLATGKAERAPVTTSMIAGEGVPVTKPNASTERDVWVLSLILDAPKKRTELWVLDGADLAAPPVARVILPHVVPLGFHGNWVPAAARAA